MLAASLAAAASPPTADELYMCPAQPPTAQLPKLKLEADLRSPKPRTETDITLVTQLSFERWGLGGDRVWVWGVCVGSRLGVWGLALTYQASFLIYYD